MLLVLLRVNLIFVLFSFCRVRCQMMYSTDRAIYVSIGLIVQFFYIRTVFFVTIAAFNSSYGAHQVGYGFYLYTCFVNVVFFVV